MKPWYCIALFAIVFAFASCGDDPGPSYPSLKIVNGSDYSTIKSVSLVGYDFQTLNITKGSSQTFVLDKGMPGGYNNIKVTVYASPYYPSGTANFTDGATTTLTLKGQGGSFTLN